MINMTIEVLTRTLIDLHNLIAKLTVSGDNTIFVGDYLRIMRNLIKTISDEGIESNDTHEDAVINDEESV